MNTSSQSLRFAQLGLALVLSIGVWVKDCGGVSEMAWHANTLIAQQELAPQWRRTRHGWVNLNHWTRPPRVEFERRIELVHPFVFSAVMGLMAAGALIWASTEDQWAIVFQPRQRPRA